jgi:hypothetical protein
MDQECGEQQSSDSPFPVVGRRIVAEHKQCGIEKEQEKIAGEAFWQVEP